VDVVVGATTTSAGLADGAHAARTRASANTREVRRGDTRGDSTDTAGVCHPGVIWRQRPQPL
jgi:hypothetical protein